MYRYRYTHIHWLLSDLEDSLVAPHLYTHREINTERKREKEREKEGEREREGERGREGGREGKRCTRGIGGRIERERERERERRTLGRGGRRSGCTEKSSHIVAEF
jgi:hypothetical protein